MGELTLSSLGSSWEATIITRAFALVLVPMMIAGILWPDSRNKLYFSIIILFIVYLAVYLTTPFWPSTEGGGGDQEPIQTYRVTTSRQLELGQMLGYVSDSGGKDVSVISYSTSPTGTDMQFSARGLREMGVVTFEEPVKLKDPVITLKNDRLMVSGALPLGNFSPKNDETFEAMVYILNGFNYSGVDESLQGMFYGAKPPVPIGTVPGYKGNGVFDDNPMVIMQKLPTVPDGVNVRLDPINGVEGGALSIMIDNVWYNVYKFAKTESAPYYSAVIMLNGVLSIFPNLNKVMNTDYSCMCDNGTLQKENTYQLTLPPSPPSTVATNNCQLGLAISWSKMRQILDIVESGNPADIFGSDLSRDNLKTVCPTYYQKCMDDSTCASVLNDRYDKCASDPNCQKLILGPWDWGPDPDGIQGSTPLDKLNNCAGFKALARMKDIDDCQMTKIYYSNCKMFTDVLTIEDQGGTDGYNFLKILYEYIFEPVCMVYKAGLGAENKFIDTSQPLLNIDPLGQYQKQCCASTK